MTRSRMTGCYNFVLDASFSCSASRVGYLRKMIRHGEVTPSAILVGRIVRFSLPFLPFPYSLLPSLCLPPLTSSQTSRGLLVGLSDRRIENRARSASYRGNAIQELNSVCTRGLSALLTEISRPKQTLHRRLNEISY